MELVDCWPIHFFKDLRLKMKWRKVNIAFMHRLHVRILLYTCACIGPTYAYMPTFISSCENYLRESPFSQNKCQFFQANFPKISIFQENISTFPGKLTKNFEFSRQIDEKFRFFQVNISEKFRYFSDNFTNKFDFSREVSEEFRFFRQFHKKIDFSSKFTKSFDFFRPFHKKISIFQGKFSKNFDF